MHGAFSFACKSKAWWESCYTGRALPVRASGFTDGMVTAAKSAPTWQLPAWADTQAAPLSLRSHCYAGLELSDKYPRLVKLISCQIKAVAVEVVEMR